MSSAPADESPDPERLRTVIQHSLTWLGWLLLGTAGVYCVWSVTITLITSGLALACAIFLHGQRRGGGHAFLLSHAVLMGGSALMLLTAQAMTDPALRFLERTVVKIFMMFFHAFGAFTWIYIIVCVILMAFILASQRDR